MDGGVLKLDPVDLRPSSYLPPPPGPYLYLPYLFIHSSVLAYPTLSHVP